MSGCLNPLWPCALTGAVTALSGFSGIAVVIHGSSGCYYYPSTLLHRELHSTFLVEQEVIFGSGERLRDVVRDLSGRYDLVAVVNSCVPSVLGEDTREILEGCNTIVIDAPGFSGDFERGYLEAVHRLPASTGSNPGYVNIEGINAVDPFSRGNLQETHRVLSLMGIPAGTVFCQDSLDSLQHVAPWSVSVNPDLSTGIGTQAGSFLGLGELQRCVDALADQFDNAETNRIEEEIRDAGERITRAADKYLKRYDPPSVAVFSTFSYAKFAATTLRQYLDAEIVVCGTRNEPSPVDKNTFECQKMTSLEHIGDEILSHGPDLVLGSSFERSISGTAAHVILTPPARGVFWLSSRPLAGPEGELLFMEAVLNACMDRVRQKNPPDLA